MTVCAVMVVIGCVVIRLVVRGAGLVISAATPIFASADLGLAVGSRLFYAESNGHDGVGVWQWGQGVGVFEGAQWHGLGRPVCRNDEGPCHPTLFDLLADFSDHESPAVVDLLLFEFALCVFERNSIR